MHIVRGFLDRKTCETWVTALNRQPGQATGVLTDINASRKIQVSDTRVTERVLLGPVEEAVTELMRQVFTTTIPEATGQEIEWFERPQVLRYTKGSHYKLHADSECYLRERRVWQKTNDRDISILLYLNDDFTGGALEFFAFHYFYQPRRGDLVFFPSDHRYAHEAHPVTSGRRYAVVSWAACKGVPKVRQEPTFNSIAL